MKMKYRADSTHKSYENRNDLVRNGLFAYFSPVLKRAGKIIRVWMSKPDVLPTYCFEYAPDC